MTAGAAPIVAAAAPIRIRCVRYRLIRMVAVLRWLADNIFG